MPVRFVKKEATGEDVVRCTCKQLLRVNVEKISGAICPKCNESLVWSTSTTCKCKRCGGFLLWGDDCHLGGVCANCLMSG
jgi:hypothetical protein